MPCEVDHREQQVADFFGACVVIGRLDLGQFLIDFRAGTARIGPVEPDACGAFLEFLGASQCGQADRHAV